MKVHKLDLIDFEKMNTLLEGFNKSTGFVTAILDFDGNVLSKSGWRQICTEFHRINPETAKKCTISDTELACKMTEGETYHFYKCLNGLIDVAVPIVINGEHIANLFSGQFFFEEPDISFFKKQAEKHGFNEEKYLAALKKVPVVSREKVKTAMDFLLNMTRLISETTFQKHKQMELHKTIEESETRFKALHNASFGGIAIHDQGVILECNQGLSEMTGYEYSELIGMNGLLLIAERSREVVINNIRTGYERPYEAFGLRKNGEEFPMQLEARNVPYKGKQVRTVEFRDITERKKAEEALKSNFALLQIAGETAIFGGWSVDLEKNICTWSDAVANIHDMPHGYSPPVQEAINFYAPEWREKITHIFSACAKDGIPYDEEMEIITQKGKRVWVRATGKAVKNEKDKIIKVQGSFQDITERKQAEEALIESEQTFRALFEKGPIGIAYHRMVYDELGNPVNYRFLAANKSYQKLTGVDPKGKLVTEAFPGIEADPFDWIGTFGRVAKTGEEIRFKQHLQPNDRWYDCVGYQYKPDHFVAAFLEITEQKRAEMDLKTQKELLEGVLDSIKDVIGVQLPDHTIVQYNRSGYELLGLSQSQVQGKKCYELLGRSGPCAICATTVSFISRAMETTETFIPELGRHFLCTSNPILDDNGSIKLIIEQLTDITEKKKIDAQLHQAQKMESVGRLAGGVAHDFNNMLGVILGHTELALLQADENHELYADLKEIQTAAMRSADITKQLLAFARKQTISPRELDLNKTVESMLNMLRRLIGENIDLVWKPAAHIWLVKMDPSQIDQILANLCVNARDAITGVGKLTIETGLKSFDEEYCKEHSGFIPGDFVLLTVSDNGCGMDKEVLDNLFEPFFTTKDVGKGSGLGLATIFGIVKQNNGFINVYSEPGQGSTFKIYLPRVFTDEDTDKVVPEKKAAAGGTETILLVEDEPSILRMTRMMLERKGYSVLPAATPGEAIDLARTHSDKIHLLMTDVVMPEMNGRDLAGQLLPLYPEIKLLFMSGYTANVIAHHGVLDDGVAFIQKPFSMADMAEKVREVLDMAPDKN